MTSSSRLFVKNRALGYVSNHIPLIIRYIERRKECVMVTCVGRHFHTYGSTHFTLLNVSGAHPEDITCLAADKFLTYTAAGKDVYVWKMGTHIRHVFTGHSCPVHLLLPFGPHLISIDESSNLKMWDVRAEDLYTELNFDNSSFRITTILHPVTYLNKVLLGSEQGQLQLWNLHTRKYISMPNIFSPKLNIFFILQINLYFCWMAICCHCSGTGTCSRRGCYWSG
jgi:U3 small nucleolar RNA-associated protein 21